MADLINDSQDLDPVFIPWCVPQPGSGPGVRSLMRTTARIWTRCSSPGAYRSQNLDPVFIP
eukprot:1012582-Prorocentrum_minimum.AAC.1